MALVSAFTNKQVIDSLCTALLPNIENMIVKAVDSAMVDAHDKLHEQEEQIHKLEQQVESLQAYSRADSVVVHGLKEAVAEAVSSNAHQ